MRELRCIARSRKNENEHKKRKKPYTYFKNMCFIGDLTSDEKNKIKLTEDDGEDLSYVDDAIVEHYANEEEILQTLINEGDPENEGEHIVIEQISSLPRQRKRKCPSEMYETQNFAEDNTPTRRNMLPRKNRNTSQLYESSADLNGSEGHADSRAEHFLDVDAYSMSRPVARELPSNSRRFGSYDIDEDEDRLFMLSMVPDMKLVPKHIKLDMKADILNVVRNYVKQAHSDQTNVSK